MTTKFSLAAATLSVASLAAASTQSAAQNFTSVEGTVVEYYDVDGKSPKDLREQMNTLGPLSLDKTERFDAFAAYRYAWQLRQRSDNSCEARIKLDSKVTFPRLVDRTKLKKKALAQWDAYLAALERHEIGHLALTYGAFKELQTALEAGPCDTASERGRAVLKSLSARHIAFDEETDHGASTGARFP